MTRGTRERTSQTVGEPRRLGRTSASSPVGRGGPVGRRQPRQRRPIPCAEGTHGVAVGRSWVLLYHPMTDSATAESIFSSVPVPRPDQRVDPDSPDLTRRELAQQMRLEATNLILEPWQKDLCDWLATRAQPTKVTKKDLQTVAIAFSEMPSLTQEMITALQESP